MTSARLPIQVRGFSVSRMNFAAERLLACSGDDRPGSGVLTFPARTSANRIERPKECRPGR